MIIDVIIAFDSSVNGEEGSLKSSSDRWIKVTALFFAHLENDASWIVDSSSRTILPDVLIQNRHFLRREGIILINYGGEGVFVVKFTAVRLNTAHLRLNDNISQRPRLMHRKRKRGLERSRENELNDETLHFRASNFSKFSSFEYDT